MSDLIYVTHISKNKKIHAREALTIAKANESNLIFCVEILADDFSKVSKKLVKYAIIELEQIFLSQLHSAATELGIGEMDYRVVGKLEATSLDEAIGRKVSDGDVLFYESETGFADAT